LAQIDGVIGKLFKTINTGFFHTMHLTATHINYYMVCRRKLWLFANGINMEHTSDTVAEGKLIHETSYPQRAERYTELTIDGSVIDFYDANKKVIHEVKKSNSIETAHEWQVKYYIWLLKRNGVDGVIGILEYPKLRETKKVELSDEDLFFLEKTVDDIQQITESENCPQRIEMKICKNCSYFEFCFVEE
jgi:CRISPR-associated exonuclease Cas4